MNDYLELIKQAALTKSIESEEITFYISEGSFKIITYLKKILFILLERLALRWK